MSWLDRITIFFASIGLISLLAVVGCDEPEETSTSTVSRAVKTDHRGQMFGTIETTLNQLDDFAPQQIRPQLRDHLNFWLREDKPAVAWQRDPLVDTLPKELADLPAVKGLATSEFTLADTRFLQEAVWLRDIAKHARGEGFDDVTIAARLFDWTVRNLQLEADLDVTIPTNNHTIEEVLLVGRATATERAWVFIELCRQLGIDAVMLAIPDSTDKSKLVPWLPAVRVKDELYLFDPRLGFPIPGPDKKPVATLSQVAADDKLLRALDLIAEHPYPIKAKDLQSVVALIEAPPESLSRGMKLVESRLAGDKRVILTALPTLLAEKLKSVKQVGEVQLWTMPYEVLAARAKQTSPAPPDVFHELLNLIVNTPLRAGRAKQLKGDYDGEKGAKGIYLNARPSEKQIEELRLRDDVKKFITQTKQTASYWLGLIFFEEKDEPMAIDYFKERVLAASPNGPWSGGARYNLGRSYEAMGEKDKARAMYLLDTSPQSTGNKLRARRLRESDK